MFKHYISLFIFSLLLSVPSFGETFQEFSMGVSRYAIDVDQKEGIQRVDESSGAIFTMGAYRHLSRKSAWGVAVEYTFPLSRDEDLPGSGRIVGFRALNYLRSLSSTTSVELYAGAAQYEWRQTANGYLFGLAYRHALLGQNVGLVLDAKYYQDLAFDSGEGDDIVDGFHSSLKFFYRF